MIAICKNNILVGFIFVHFFPLKRLKLFNKRLIVAKHSLFNIVNKCEFLYNNIPIAISKNYILMQ